MAGLGNFMRLLGIGENRERIVIKGSDFDVMQLVAEDFRYYLDEQEFIRGSRVSYNRRQPEIHLDFDPILLTSYEITRANISSGLAALNPEYSSGTSFKIGEDTYDIIIRNDIPGDEENEEEEAETEKKDKTVDDLRRVQIQNANGGLHDLQDLASVNYGRGRTRIMRVNQDKQIEVFYNFSKDVQSSKDLLEGYRSDIDQLVANYNLPSGVAVEVFHEEDQFADFKFLILAAFILIFMILASVFESLVTPFVLLFSIPLAAIGSLLALLLTSNSLLNANTLTGFLILLGVVVNNGIILIDYSNILRKRGYRRNRALMTRYHCKVFSSPIQTVGIRISVSNAENVNPPITVMANGAPIAPAYSESPIANGNMATIVVIDVIRIGWIRDKPAVINALLRL